MSKKRDAELLEEESVTYTTLLNEVTETGSLPQWQKDLMMNADLPKTTETSRLQVFEDIPDSLSDSVISIE